MKNTFFYIFLLICFGFVTSVYGQDSSLTTSPIDNPENFSQETEYDAENGIYQIQTTVGDDVEIGPGEVMDFEDYQDFRLKQFIQNYWRDQNQSVAEDDEIIPSVSLKKPILGKIFGSDVIDIKPQGSAEVDFRINHTYRDDRSIPEALRGNTSFRLDQDIQVNVVGKIGDKLQLTMKYDTDALFSFDNEMKLGYTGEEDEILKTIELGNVSLPLTGTLITGTQSLFGAKTQLQFGRTTVTAVFSEQKSETNNVRLEGGGQKSLFEVAADEYDEDRHYFLGRYFYENYDNALRDMPFVNSPVDITKIEVWVTNTRADYNNARNILALTNVGESTGVLPDNGVDPSTDPAVLVGNNPDFRDIYLIEQAAQAVGLESVVDYQRVEGARLLRTNEYSFNQKLGFISLNQRLRDNEVLAVAYQYTANGQVYQIGEFSNDVNAPGVLMLKLLKGNTVDVKHPTWDLMMKNVYSLNAFQVNKEDFDLNVMYRQPETGNPIRFLPEEGYNDMQLIELMNLDNLNENGDNGMDGFFDFLSTPILTIDAAKGKVYLPSVEPFGERGLQRWMQENNPSVTQATIDKYLYQEIYELTKYDAAQIPEKNRFLLKGSYKSAGGSDIYLNAFNLPKGAVKVTQGSETLIEGADYIVDYSLGRVTITNESKLNAGTPINVSVESRSLFSFQTKRYMGLHVDHRISDDLIFGGTILNLRESPLTNKINYGEEPINNTIWGMNGSYQGESMFLTRMVDKIPFVDTKEKSTFFVNAEFAQFLPGHPDIIDIDEGGTAYIDDFENGQTEISMLFPRSWKLASVPLGIDNDEGKFIEADKLNSIESGFNRADLKWYQIDDVFYGTTAPGNIEGNTDILEDPYQREVKMTEIFTNKDLAAFELDRLRPLNLTFNPKTPGMYNFDVEPVQDISDGITADGELVNPETRWGGIMQKVRTTDWEEANIEFIEFWMMDPYLNNPDHEGGNLYINIGNISEDILQDSRKSFENGLPTADNLSTVDTTDWGIVSNSQSIIRSFDNANGASQDLGYDGLSDEDERTFVPKGNGGYTQSYLDRIQAAFGIGSNAYTTAEKDPARDNYGFFLTDEQDAIGADIISRYSSYNGSENNTYNNFAGNGSTIPNTEDINDDNTLNDNQNYFQYEVDLHPDKLSVEENPYIVQEISDVGPKGNTNWYLFRVPVSEFQESFGSINNFKSIGFLRLFLHGFKEEVTLRFGTLDMVRGNWRKYTQEVDEGIDVDSTAAFVVSSVNIEENGLREPVNYVLPPGIEREILQGASYNSAQNEQSLSLKVCDLDEGASKAIFKNLGVDLRNYKRLKMYVHGESAEDEFTQSGDMSLFVRMGTDYKENYYEYELPLEMTSWGDNNPNSVWPAANIVDIDFDRLIQLKLDRNQAIRETVGGADPVDYTTKFSQNLTDGKTLFVRGNPNLGDVRSIMIGVRNTGNDGEKCAEIWINELRLADFDQEPGWAFKAEAKTKLADFADLNINGGYSTYGFGSLEQSLSERTLENVRDFGFNTTVQAGDLFPESFGVNLPIYYGVNDVLKTPKFNPYDPDVRYEDALDAVTGEERSQLENKVEDKVTHKSFNISGIKIEPKKKNKKPHFYDLKNVSASYSFTEMKARNQNVSENIERQYQGTVGYSYNIGPKRIQPFKSFKFLKSKYLRLIKEFNFSLIPKSITASTTVTRDFKKKTIRPTTYIGDTSPPVQFDPIYTQNLNFRRRVNVKYDLTKSMKFTFDSNTQSRFDDEEQGAQTPNSRIWAEIGKLRPGNPRSYRHTFTGSYELPFKYFPWTDFMKVTAKYNATYDWMAGKLFEGDETARFGHTIQNNAERQIKGVFTLDKFYKKMPFLSRAYKRKSRRKASTKKKEKEDPEEEDDDKKKKKKKKNPSDGKGLDFLAGLMTSVKKIDITYRETIGTVLPGFRYDAQFMGQNFNTLDGAAAPGWGFILGDHADIRNQANNSGWLIENNELNSQYSRIHGVELGVKGTIEPIKRFKISVNANRSYSLNRTEYYRYDPLIGDFAVQNTNEVGNFNITINSISTAFDDMDAMYQSFLEKRKEIAFQMAGKRTGLGAGAIPVDENGFPIGFNGTSQEVLIPAFLNTYGGKSTSESIEDIADFKDAIPIPNWSVRYDGLKNWKPLRKKLKSVSLTSGYSSVYTIGSFSRNLLFDPLQTSDSKQYTYNDDPTDVSTANFDASGNFIGEYQIAQVTIQEQFNPLIKVDVTTKSNFSSSFEYKTSRMMTLNINSSQLLEEKAKSFVVGFGYRINDIKIFKKSKSKSTVPRTLDFNVDIDYTYSKSLIRNIFDETQQVNSGNEQFGINASVNYIINEKISANVYFNRNASESFVSTSFPLTDTNFGFKLRYSLTQ